VSLSLDLDALDYTKSGGLVTVVTQDAATGAVLMVAHADREALSRCLSSGEMHYTSRSRGPWHKGATSGHVQHVVSLEADCDGDAVLARVQPMGPACHTGSVSCFSQAGGQADAHRALVRLDCTIAERATGLSSLAASRPAAISGSAAQKAAHETSGMASTSAPDRPPPTESYTVRLLRDRNLRLKKLGEEAVELATACADGDPLRGAEEGADLLYHALVALRAIGVSLGDVCGVLEARAGRNR
jgi:phosphoribosyl-ATP pyrophosphohydrolase/phosphoribosyl-AMP cyclohydrolase